jgi:hypothetical protein
MVVFPCVVVECLVLGLMDGAVAMVGERVFHGGRHPRRRQHYGGIYTRHCGGPCARFHG